MLSQFSGESITLKDLTFDFPNDVYPIGRLDKDSEGLLILTNDGSLNKTILNPNKACPKQYWVQVEGIIEKNHLIKLSNGVNITVNKKIYKTLPCVAEIIATPNLPERNPPIRYRKSVPTSWCKITIVEGKNRQIRKMLAAVGFPVLRLARMSIGGLKIDHFHVGKVKEISKNEIIRSVFL